ncbi:hypothetical protein [Halorussus litoreus]|uniref:hypothetical protein n=1 Tax=Halorussus litoreus TaxID=1710536 RepID=UPI000E22EF5D|nr:hypothetical protein [Halorussus litoreus]
MAFSYISLRRTIPAGVLAYLAQFAVAFALLGSRVGTALQSIQVEMEYGDADAFTTFVDGSIPTWKAVGWFLHSAHNAKLVAPLPDFGTTLTLNLVSRTGGQFQLLYLLPPIALVAAGFLVARTSTTYGARGEQYTGASVALGYVPCCIVGGLLFTVGRPAIGPSLLQSILYAGIGYPVVFGYLGGFAARWTAESSGETTSIGGETN